MSTLWRTIAPMMHQFQEIQGMPPPWYNYVALQRSITGDGDEWNLISVLTNINQDLGDCPAPEMPAESMDEMERLGEYLKISGSPKWYADWDECVWVSHDDGSD